MSILIRHAQQLFGGIDVNIITTEQLCETLQLSRTAILRLIRRGMPTLRLSARVHRYDWDAVLIWLNEESNKFKESLESTELPELPEVEEEISEEDDQDPAGLID